MNIKFSIEEAVKKRYSVRNYNEEEVEANTWNMYSLGLENRKQCGLSFN